MGGVGGVGLLREQAMKRALPVFYAFTLLVILIMGPIVALALWVMNRLGIGRDDD